MIATRTTRPARLLAMGFIPLAVATLAACGSASGGHGSDHAGMMGSASSSSVPATPSASSSASTSAADPGATTDGDDLMAEFMFATMMIPHHQQALDMAALVPGRTTNPELIALAEDIAAAQGPEIAQMTQWLAAHGVTDTMGHAGHVMSGMLDPDEMAQLADASGTEFDRLWLEGMIGHHEGAIEMADAMLAAGTDPELRQLATDIVTAQDREIAQMRTMLDQLPN